MDPSPEPIRSQYTRASRDNDSAMRQVDALVENTARTLWTFGYTPVTRAKLAECLGLEPTLVAYSIARLWEQDRWPEKYERKG